MNKFIDGLLKFALYSLAGVISVVVLGCIIESIGFNYFRGIFVVVGVPFVLFLSLCTAWET